MKASDNALQLLHQFEKFKPYLYDTDGGGHCTVGWGHLVHRGQCDGRENEKQFIGGITQSVGDTLLKSDLEWAESSVTRMLNAHGVTANQNQFDALVVFAFNVGSGNFAKVVMRVSTSVDPFSLDKFPDQMQQYVNSGGKFSKGLQARRAAEVALFYGKL